MSALLNILFSGLWAIFGSDSALPAATDTWHGESAWHEAAGQFQYRAHSTAILEQCRAQPEAYLDFPMVIDGAHEIYADGQLLRSFSDMKLKEVRSIYGKPHVPCRDLLAAHELEWRVVTDCRYFARFIAFPNIETERPRDNLFSETLNIAAAGSLLLMAFFCLIIFTGKVSGRLVGAYFASTLCLMIYFAFSVPGLFWLPLSITAVHRYGDSSLVLGFALLYGVLALQDLIGPRVLKFGVGVNLFAMLLQFSGRTNDEIQMGTSLAFIPVFVIMAAMIPGLVRKLRRRASVKFGLLQSAGLLLLVGSSLNDILIVSGAYDGYLVLPIGIVAIMMFLALGVHETILETYRERDFLRANLEREVERKTAELRQTQAELIHSAKLASLGTLSAGIAHEINNSINFVSGAIQPLEKLVNKLELVSPRDLEIGRKLLHAIKDGVSITVEIVKSLRQFTGLNQAKFKDLFLHEVARSVMVILHSKIKDKYEVELEIDPGLQMYGDVVGINQILMNLVTNAIDAMPNGGRITVRALQADGRTEMEVRDTGSGIPEAIRERIFDPFFTTKEVGAGTGLGLYIIANEMKKYGGTVSCQSRVGEGTSFTLSFPNVEPQMAGDAACIPIRVR